MGRRSAPAVAAAPSAEPAPLMRVISLGAGVQSTTMALMATRGLITPMPDCAIFADVQAEPAAVYRHLDWLEKQLPFPVHRVTAGSLKQHIVDAVAGSRFAGAPFYANSTSEGGGMLRRQCTREFKLAPLMQKERELLGAQKGENIAQYGVQIEQWIGISLDEVSRMRTSNEKWKTHRYPLVDLRMTRGDCLNWMARNGYPRPPRSACTFCPYHSDAEWRKLRDETPEEWQEVVALDRLIRSGVRGTVDPLYIHRSLKPLDEVDLSTPEDHGQLSLFTNECEGMCGV